PFGSLKGFKAFSQRSESHGLHAAFMSNAESSPRPEEGQDRNPAQAPNPAGPDEAPRAEPTARPDAAQPQPAGTDGPPAAAEQARPEPGPEQAPPAGPTEPQAQQTRAMPSGPPPSAPH